MSERTNPEQLTLLSPNVPLQFRLDTRTRQVGLANIAAIRAAMASRRHADVGQQPAAPQPAHRQTDVAA
jgi:hypothetical protein